MPTLVVTDMGCRLVPGFFSRLAIGIATVLSVRAADPTFTVATYNLENYVAVGESSRPPKSAEAKAMIRESIRAMRPDVLALQEIGTTNALTELRATLAGEGLAYPHWEHVAGWDTNIFVAVLSRFPITARRSQRDINYLLQGRRMHVSRGFVDVDVQVNSSYSFTLITGHLKSRLDSAVADQSDIRAEEARLLREIIDARFAASPDLNLIVLGDFNDTKDSEPVRRIVGQRGRNALLDTRPSERQHVSGASRERSDGSRIVTWTYHFSKEDTYSRIDYIFLSRGMAREWQRDESYVLAMPGWGVASDHRPVLARFIALNR